MDYIRWDDRRRATLLGFCLNKVAYPKRRDAIIAFLTAEGLTVNKKMMHRCLEAFYRFTKNRSELRHDFRIVHHWTNDDRKRIYERIAAGATKADRTDIIAEIAIQYGLKDAYVRNLYHMYRRALYTHAILAKYGLSVGEAVSEFDCSSIEKSFREINKINPTKAKELRGVVRKLAGIVLNSVSTNTVPAVIEEAQPSVRPGLEDAYRELCGQYNIMVRKLNASEKKNVELERTNQQITTLVLKTKGRAASAAK